MLGLATFNRNIDSLKDESIPIVDNTYPSFIPTSPRKCYNLVMFCSNTYYEMVEPIESSLYWPYIELVLAIR